jgi:hypothetical protein
LLCFRQDGRKYLFGKQANSMAEMDWAAHPQSQQLIRDHEEAGRNGPI